MQNTQSQSPNKVFTTSANLKNALQYLDKLVEKEEKAPIRLFKTIHEANPELFTEDEYAIYTSIGKYLDDNGKRKAYVTEEAFAIYMEDIKDVKAGLEAKIAEHLSVIKPDVFIGYLLNSRSLLGSNNHLPYVEFSKDIY